MRSLAALEQEQLRPDEKASAVPLDIIRTALEGLRYGVVTLQVHDGAVVAVELTEKIRFTRSNRRL